MFVARRVLKVVDESGVRQYRPGDIIPDFASWAEVPRRAHINMEFVEEVPDLPTQAPVRVESPAPAKGKKKRAATAAS